LALFGALSRQPVELIWVTCDETDDRPAGYEVWTPWRGIYGEAPAWRRGIRYARGVVSVLRRGPGHARRRRVVVHPQISQVPFVELPFVAAVQRAGVPCILTPHDIEPYADASRSAGLLPRLYRRYDALIASSRHGRDELAALLGGAAPPISVIPLGHLNDAYGGGP